MGLGAGGSYREQLGQVHSQGFPCSFPLVPCSLLESFWYRFAKHQVWKAIGIGAVTGSLALSLQGQYNWEGILKLCKAEETIGNLCNNGLQSEAGTGELLLACSCFIITENLKQTLEEHSTGFTVTSTWLIWFFLLSFSHLHYLHIKLRCHFPINTSVGVFFFF